MIPSAGQKKAKEQTEFFKKVHLSTAFSTSDPFKQKSGHPFSLQIWNLQSRKGTEKV